MAISPRDNRPDTVFYMAFVPLCGGRWVRDSVPLDEGTATHAVASWCFSTHGLGSIHG